MPGPRSPAVVFFKPQVNLSPFPTSTPQDFSPTNRQGCSCPPIQLRCLFRCPFVFHPTPPPFIRHRCRDRDLTLHIQIARHRGTIPDHAEVNETPRQRRRGVDQRMPLARGDGDTHRIAANSGRVEDVTKFELLEGPVRAAFYGSRLETLRDGLS
ncbi:hypothetical protein B0H12DRAFT_1149107 [Mycena haematopus]|nr:hypothetical protein B0H12DRAFT_1149107 [Mycena haematopus]